MEKIKSITKLKSPLKVGDWLLAIQNGDKRKTLFKILKFVNNFKVITENYEMSEENFKKDEECSNLKKWDFTRWNWYKLNERDIVKWKKIILVKSL